MTFPPWEPAFWLAIPLRKSVNPFGGDLCFGWLGSLRLYLYKPLGCVSTLWNWMPAGKDITMHYQKVLKMPESIPYLSVGFDVGADFTWMSIMLPNGILIGKPFKIIHDGGLFIRREILRLPVFKPRFRWGNIKTLIFTLPSETYGAPCPGGCLDGGAG